MLYFSKEEISNLLFIISANLASDIYLSLVSRAMPRAERWTIDRYQSRYSYFARFKSSEHKKREEKREKRLLEF